MSHVKEESVEEQVGGPIELGVVRDLTPQQQRTENLLQQAEKRVRHKVEQSMEEATARAAAAYQLAQERIAALPEELASMPLIELERLRKQQAGVKAVKKAPKVSGLLSLIGDKLEALPMYEGHPEALGEPNEMLAVTPYIEPPGGTEIGVKEEEPDNRQAGSDHFTIVWDSQASLTEQQRQQLQQRVASTVKNFVADWQDTGK